MCACGRVGVCACTRLRVCMCALVRVCAWAGTPVRVCAKCAGEMRRRRPRPGESVHRKCAEGPFDKCARMRACPFYAHGHPARPSRCADGQCPQKVSFGWAVLPLFGVVPAGGGSIREDLGILKGVWVPGSVPVGRTDRICGWGHLGARFERMSIRRAAARCHRTRLPTVPQLVVHNLCALRKACKLYQSDSKNPPSQIPFENPFGTGQDSGLCLRLGKDLAPP
jgi:hypothetical protein